jgi:uncharacterized protein with PIN domain/sulfur carrier protein ThiS
MLLRVDVRFFDGLDDLLAPKRRGGTIATEVAAGTTVKDLAESLGIPHTEIAVIVVNDESVDFSCQLQDGDRMSVYPPGGVPPGPALVRLDPPALREPRFVLDVHLGRLARSLRLLGFDCVWRNDITDEELVEISVAEQRTLLTRDRGILKRAKVARGYLVRATDRRRQTIEVLRRFDLVAAIAPFGRCLACNGVLEPVAKKEVECRLPLRTRREFDDFHRCTQCARIYWKGSHFDRLVALVEDVRRAGAAT